MEKTKPSSGKKRKKPDASVEGLPEAPRLVSQVLLSVHLWAEGGGHAPELALAMVGDLLSASPCELREGFSFTSYSTLAASFSDRVQAVNATRRLRRLVESFSMISKAGRLGGGFILSAAEEASRDVETELKQLYSVLARDHSGQFLVVGSLCEPVRSIPGLRFETLSEEQLAQGVGIFCGPVMQLMPPAQMEGGSTNCWAPAVEPRAEVEFAQELPAPLFETDARAVEQTPEWVPPIAVKPLIRTHQGVAGSPRVPEVAGRGFPLRWVVLGSVLVVALSAIAIRVSGSRKSEASGTQSLPLVQPASIPLAVAPAKVAISPDPTPPVIADDPAPLVKPGKLDAQEARDAAKAKRKAIKDQAADAGDTGAGAKKDSSDRSGIYFSADEINSLIERADRDSGNGDFDAAISTYNIILKHDRSNARAKAGLARATKNRDSQ